MELHPHSRPLIDGCGPNYSPMTQTGSGSGVIERLRAPVAQAPSWQQ